MKLKIAIIAFTIFLIQGCIPSLHPLWTQDTLVFEKNLLGTWLQTESEGKYSWNFSGGFDKENNQAAMYV